MTLQELNQMITALENSSCTFPNCQKLASLYTCREYFRQSEKIPTNRKIDPKSSDLKTV